MSNLFFFYRNTVGENPYGVIFIDLNMYKGGTSPNKQEEGKQLRREEVERYTKNHN